MVELTSVRIRRHLLYFPIQFDWVIGAVEAEGFPVTAVREKGLDAHCE